MKRLHRWKMLFAGLGVCLLLALFARFLCTGGPGADWAAYQTKQARDLVLCVGFLSDAIVLQAVERALKERGGTS